MRYNVALTIIKNEYLNLNNTYDYEPSRSKIKKIDAAIQCISDRIEKGKISKASFLFSLDCLQSTTFCLKRLTVLAQKTNNDRLIQFWNWKIISLARLPYEILEKIFYYLDNRSLDNLQVCSKELVSLAIRPFPTKARLEQNYKSIYSYIQFCDVIKQHFSRNLIFEIIEMSNLLTCSENQRIEKYELLKEFDKSILDFFNKNGMNSESLPLLLEIMKRNKLINTLTVKRVYNKQELDQILISLLNTRTETLNFFKIEMSKEHLVKILQLMDEKRVLKIVFQNVKFISNGDKDSIKLEKNLKKKRYKYCIRFQ